MTLQSRKKFVKSQYDDGTINGILKSRGITDIKAFLNPLITDITPSTKLFNSKDAAKKIVKAAKEGKKIIIHGDYDCDGVCATAILWEYLFYDLPKVLGKKVDVKPYIPDRLEDGYGLSESSINAMLEDNPSLIITVDCGIRDRERIEKYISQDLDIIVTDHHQPPSDISEAKYTVVHQMFPGHEYPYASICGSAISFLLVSAIKKEVGDEYAIKENTKGLDLVALATVTDMMPLLDINRIFVTFGLKQLQSDSRIGISAIARLASVNIAELDSYHLGFVVGPRINAAGRIGKAMDALRLVVARNQKSALEYSSQLYNLNTLRQENTSEILLQIDAILPEMEEHKLLFIHGEGWHEGVIGLAAGKIFERFGKPVVITTLRENIVKGSARSIAGFNITKAIELFSSHLSGYGGHAQAAGFSTTPEQLDEFRKKLVKYADENIAPDLLEQQILCDISLSPKDLSTDIYNDIASLKPFGYGNQNPVVLLEGVKVEKKQELSNGKHLKLICSKDSSITTLLLFGCDEDINQIQEGDILDVVGNMALNRWGEKEEIQIHVKGWKKIK